MIYLRQSTSSQEVPLGYFVDEADGNTAETSLTIANTDIKIWKAGSTTLADKNSGGATHMSGGVYYTVLDATDTDTVGPLVIFVHKSGALPVIQRCVVMDGAVYDQMMGSTAFATAGDVAAAVWDSTRSSHTAAGSFGQGVVVASNSDKTGYVLSAAGSAALTEGYAADGTAPTLAQMLYMIWSRLSEFAISGTTITARRLDGTTTSMTFLLNDASNPTSVTRAS